MKAGSVGNTQERCCQGLSASSASQRAIVEADASQTPRSITSRCSSAREKRESGTPSLRGSEQAIAFTSAICSGGKTARTSSAGAVIEPGQPLLEETLPPHRDRPQRAVEAARDLRV